MSLCPQHQGKRGFLFPRVADSFPFLSLLSGAFKSPRAGKSNDRAHPPIHPTKLAKATDLADATEQRIYEFVVRHFLACCSDDAKGDSVCVELTVADELFDTSGLTITERNYLDVYPYDRWIGNVIPKFSLHETVSLTSLLMTEGKTSAPSLLTEADLISVMDKNGIGKNVNEWLPRCILASF